MVECSLLFRNAASPVTPVASLRVALRSSHSDYCCVHLASEFVIEGLTNLACRNSSLRILDACAPQW
jgi:hypothetical protein